jgi:site-specific DNA-methyltransferase (adenine-specific)
VSVTYLIGDTRDRIAKIPDGSVALVATSPPFVALRSYLPADHPMKHAEIGSEPDPATFIDTLLALTAEWGRVLAQWGSIAVELGDTFAGGSAQGTDQGGTERYPNGRGQQGLINAHKKGEGIWPRPKCLALVPQAYALSLAYGRNVLNGEPSPAGQWLVRNMIVWHRPNPAVGALGDKYRPSTSYITVATRSPKRWFDLTAVRCNTDTDGAHRRVGVASASRGIAGGDSGNPDKERPTHNPAGAPPLDAWFDQHDTWTVTTQPSSLAHYAMWPPKLAERLVLSMCPQWVCATCGEPRRRVEGKAPEYAATRPHIGDFKKGHGTTTGLNGTTQYTNDGRRHIDVADNVTLGWTDCGHDNYRPGVVLDPFAGTGTTLAVADCHGRDAIGIDIDERNRALYDARRAEVRKTLFGVAPENPNQLDLFGNDAA